MKKIINIICGWIFICFDVFYVFMGTIFICNQLKTKYIKNKPISSDKTQINIIGDNTLHQFFFKTLEINFWIRWKTKEKFTFWFSVILLVIM